MTAQRYVKNRTVENKEVTLQKNIGIVFLDLQRPAKETITRWVWVCDVCGMVHLASAPQACEGCGVRNALTMQQDSHNEMNDRC